MPGVPLSPEILERWRRAAAGVDAPIVRALRPGLSDADIGVVEQQLGHRVPSEVATLWRWGSIGYGGDGDELAGRVMFPDWCWVSTEDAVYETQTWAEDYADRSRDPEGSPFDWRPGYTVFGAYAAGASVLVTGGAGDAAETSPVGWIDDEYEGPTVVAASLGELFTWWTEQLETRPAGIDEDGWLEIEGHLGAGWGLPTP